MTKNYAHHVGLLCYILHACGTLVHRHLLGCVESSTAIVTLDLYVLSCLPLCSPPRASCQRIPKFAEALFTGMFQYMDVLTYTERKLRSTGRSRSVYRMLCNRILPGQKGGMHTGPSPSPFTYPLAALQGRAEQSQRSLAT